MIAELRKKVQSAMARSVAAEQGSEEVAARVAALEARSKELHQIQVRLIACCLSSCLVQTKTFTKDMLLPCLHVQSQKNDVIAELKQQLQQAAAKVVAAEQEAERAMAQLAAQQQAHSKALHQIQASLTWHNSLVQVLSEHTLDAGLLLLLLLQRLLDALLRSF